MGKATELTPRLHLKKDAFYENPISGCIQTGDDWEADFETESNDLSFLDMCEEEGKTPEEAWGGPFTELSDFKGAA